MPESMDEYESDDPGDELLTSAGVRKLAHISSSTLKRAVKAGKITPALRTPGGHFRFRRSDVDALLNSAEAAS